MIAAGRLLLTCLLIATGLRAFAQAPADNPLLTSAQAIHALTPDQAAKNPQVKITATVTYYDPRTALFVQDHTGGVYINPGGDDLGLRAGDLVLVTGVAAPGRLNPIIESPVFKNLGRALLPAPKVLNAEEFFTLATDCDRVQIRGILRSIGEVQGRLVYYVGVGNQRVPVTINTLARSQGLKRIGKTISVTGVHGAIFSATRETYGSRIFCPSLSDIRTIESATPTPTDIPVSNVDALEKFPNGQLVRLQALCDQFLPAQSVTVHDTTGSLTARTSQHGTEILPNTLLDIVGYVGRTNGAIILDDAYFQRIGFGHTRTFAPREQLPDLKLIISASEIRRLSSEEAKRGYPVRLRGVITYYDPNWKLCFLQGSTEGIYIDTHGQAMDLSPGQLVVVSGFTAPGDFAPMVTSPKFDIEGSAPMPDAKPVPFNALITGAEDSQWIETDCVIRAVEDIGFASELEAVPTDSSKGIFQIVVPKSIDAPGEAASLIGSRIKVEAVCTTMFDDARRLRGIRLLCPSVRYLQLIDSSKADPFGLPVMSIGAAFQFRPNVASDRRIHVLGTVTWTDDRGTFFIQDSTGGLKATGEGAKARVGNRVHVVGFRGLSDLSPSLERALLKPAGDAAAIAPESVGAAYILGRAAAVEARLIRTKGNLLESRRTTDGVELLVRDGQNTFSASLLGAVPKDLAELEPGTPVQLTGVAVFDRDASLQPHSMRLLSRAPADIRPLGAPPFLNARRLTIAVTVSLLFCLLAVLWISILRNRVEHHRAKLEANMEIQRALEARVLQSQKMESIGNLAGGVAHDFNNMLMVIIGYADSLRIEGLSSRGKAAVEEIIRSGKRAADLTRQLLVFSRKQAPERKTLDLNKTVHDLHGMLKRLLREDISLHFEPGPGPMLTDADKTMIDQVIMNLAVNAADAMPNGGSLQIATTRKTIQAAANGNSKFKPGDYLCLSVTDTGIGIAEENLPKIFEPFFTTKEIGRGTGLGLATVYGIVNQHNGWIDVRSKPGHGTTFEIYFPATEGTEPAAIDTPRPEPAAHAAGGVILFVEDEEPVRRLASHILRKAGYEVLQADSGPAALRLAKANPNIDLLVTDVIMPGGMTGGELAEQIKQQYPHIAIILTSGYSDFRGQTLKIPDGALFLQKPYTPDVLLDAITKVLPAKATPPVHA